MEMCVQAESRLFEQLLFDRDKKRQMHQLLLYIDLHTSHFKGRLENAASCTDGSFSLVHFDPECLTENKIEVDPTVSLSSTHGGTAAAPEINL